MTIRVKVKEIDTSLLNSGGRTLDIKPSGKKGFTTPTQPISRPEMTANSYITFDGPLNTYLGVIQIDIKGDRYQKFIKNNGETKKIIRRITKYSDLMCFHENLTVMDVRSLTPENKKEQKLLLETQLIPKYLDNISIPLIKTNNVTELKKIIKDWVDNAEQFNKGAIPQITLKDNVSILRKKIKLIKELAETETCNIINVRYANPINYLNQYVELWDLRESNVLVNCYNVPRTGFKMSGGLHDSPLLYLQRYGIDTISYYTQTPSEKYYLQLKSKPCPKSIDELEFKWPYHPGGIILPSDFWKSLSKEKVDCNCSICKENEPVEIINNHCHIEENEIDISSMDYTSKIHGVLSSEIEFNKIKKYINTNEMKSYVETIEEKKKSFKKEFLDFDKK